MHPPIYPTAFNILTRPQTVFPMQISPHLSNVPPHNTRAPLYDFRHIDPANLTLWTGFDYHTITSSELFRELLQSPVKNPAVPNSPARNFLPNEATLRDHLSFVWIDINRTLDAVFAAERQTPLTPPCATFLTNLTRIYTYTGEEFKRFLPDSQLLPDRISLTAGASGEVRLVGDIKPSWNWNPQLLHHRNPAYLREFYQAISQVYTYAQQARVRYFYILTDQCLVCFRRQANAASHPINGGLEMSPPIYWATQGPGRLTVALALWFLNMHAAQDNGWQLRSTAFDERGRRIALHPTFLHEYIY
ncbi:hypothetical protein BD410DRAFT_839327 [Rickenella mellea]|uniref:Fungal-type protein kinase domain-containing protein n=1 Tax=Rickenella mellea TaxID=50990 RepID=A0A4Y7Q625_9AGAM|nr:hypothetical protein BD410DRAFT_839327 [Rickenella mellea]